MNQTTKDVTKDIKNIKRKRTLGKVLTIIEIGVILCLILEIGYILYHLP
jgi:hypothetical protein